MHDFGLPTEEKKIDWDFEGAFSIVFKEGDDTRKLLAPGLKELGFRIHSIGYECDIASCANLRIAGDTQQPSKWNPGKVLLCKLQVHRSSRNR